MWWKNGYFQLQKLLCSQPTDSYLKPFLRKGPVIRTLLYMFTKESSLVPKAWMLRYRPWRYFLPCEFSKNLRFQPRWVSGSIGLLWGFHISVSFQTAWGFRNPYETFQAEAGPSDLSRSHFCFRVLHAEWVFSCRVQFDSRPNLLPHFLQPYGLSATWLCRWSTYSLFSGKVFPHSGHLNIFFLIWIPSWRLRWEFWRKFFPHFEHE